MPEIVKGVRTTHQVIAPSTQDAATKARNAADAAEVAERVAEVLPEALKKARRTRKAGGPPPMPKVG